MITLGAVVEGIDVTIPLASTGAPFTAVGRGTVAGHAGAEVTFAGSVTPENGLHGALTVGAKGMLPTGNPTFSVEMGKETAA
jgi:hypothetical protein